MKKRGTLKEYLSRQGGLNALDYFRNGKDIGDRELVMKVKKGSSYFVYELLHRNKYKDAYYYVLDKYGEDTVNTLKELEDDFENVNAQKKLTDFVLGDDYLTSLTAEMIRNNKDWFRENAFLFMTDPKVIHNKWMIHFTHGNGKTIYDNGFYSRVGDDNLDNLAFSRINNHRKAEKNGYVYAYAIDNVNPNVAYGMEGDAIMFQSNGIEVSHSWDKDRQVVCPMDSIRNVVYLKQIKPMSYIIYCNNGKFLFTKRPLDIYEAMDWVSKNFNQYKNILVKKPNKPIRESKGDFFNIKNVYHVSSESFDDFNSSKYYFFSNNPIRLNGNKHTYICNLSMHKPFVFTEGNSWDYPLWLYLSDKDGYLIDESEFTKEKYDGYLGCPFEFWKMVYYDKDEYITDEIPLIVKSLNLGYDGVILKNVFEGDNMDMVDDYIVFDKAQIQIVKKT